MGHGGAPGYRGRRRVATTYRHTEPIRKGMHPMKSLCRPVAVLALSATVLAGCLPGGDDETSSGNGAGEQQTSVAVTGNPEDGAREAGIDLANPPAPIAKVTFKPSGQDDIDTTTIELLELKRHENVMLATFRLTGEGRGNEEKNAHQLLGYSSFQPVFIDMKKLEKYRHVDDLTTRPGNVKARLGEPIFMFTAFPLPRDGVTSMDLQMTGAAAVVADIPMP